jgi:UDP-3-O-[3-hydroxymyristoyl] N-acetylglucosamine deacetylase/3-hydroxyacyl-[acyl-carrier-protein] dehydratase
VKTPIWARDEDSVIVVLPCSEFKISYTLSYPQPALGDQFMELTVTPEVFERELVGARTFCLAEEAEMLIQSGLGKGASYENTLVVGKEGIEQNALRYEKEFIRHKILDLIGDFYLFGMAVKGHVIAVKSGHTLNTRILEKMREQSAQQAMVGIRSVAGIDASSAIDAAAIMKILPHRYPFLLVDRVLSLEEGKCAVGVKNVSINEDFFQGHFPGRPVMPGVLIIEAMAQVGGVLMLSPRENRGKLAFFMAANNIKFRRPVVPGDQLMIEVTVGKIRSRTGQVKTQALVDGEVVAEAELMFALVES